MIELLFRVFRIQQKRGITSAAISGPSTGLTHQDSTAVPLTSTLVSLLQRLTRLNIAIKNVMSKGEEESGVQEGNYRR